LFLDVIPSPMGAVAKYCDDHMSVCPRGYWNHAIYRPTNFCACCSCPWLGPRPACWW